MEKMGRVEAEHFDEVAWEPMQKVMKSVSTQTKHWIIKRAANECGTNAILFQRRQRNDDKCSFCGEIETTMHIYKCQHKDVKDLWRKLVYELENDLLQQQTDPVLAKQLCKGLLQWQHNGPVEGNSLLNAQSRTGWNGILEGCLSKEWIEAQEKYYNKNLIKNQESRGQDWL
jgi:hypothetical protein